MLIIVTSVKTSVSRNRKMVSGEQLQCYICYAELRGSAVGSTEKFGLQ